MILFNLKCAHDHRFEAWFANGQAYERLVEAGEITCPQCGDQSVTKAPMAPNIHTRRAHHRERPTTPAPESAPPQQATDAPATSEPPASLTDGSETKVWQVMQQLRQAVVENYDNVGDKFVEEARAIHEGTVEKRDIYGQATLEEARELLEDGVPVLPLPPERKIS